MATKAWNSRHEQFYLVEIYFLANAIKNKCDDIFSKCAAPKDQKFIKVDPALHFLLEGVIYHADQIANFLHVPPKREDDARPRSELEYHRASILRDILKGVSLEEILKSDVRNSLQHFDKCLDAAILSVGDANNLPAPWMCMNLILSGRDIFKPKMFPVRIYIASERMFLNVGLKGFGQIVEVNIGRIYSEALEILRILEKVDEIRLCKDIPQGGLILKLVDGPGIIADF